jgi:hypothetical protein
MVRIECALQPVTPPQHRALESSVHRPEDSPERPQSHARKPTTLDVGHDRLRDARCDRDVGLPKAAPATEHPQRSTDPLIIHAQMVK